MDVVILFALSPPMPPKLRPAIYINQGVSRQARCGCAQSHCSNAGNQWAVSGSVEVTCWREMSFPWHQRANGRVPVWDHASARPCPRGSWPEADGFALHCRVQLTWTGHIPRGDRQSGQPRREPISLSIRRDRADTSHRQSGTIAHHPICPVLTHKTKAGSRHPPHDCLSAARRRGNGQSAAWTRWSAASHHSGDFR